MGFKAPIATSSTEIAFSNVHNNEPINEGKPIKSCALAGRVQSLFNAFMVNVVSNYYPVRVHTWRIYDGAVPFKNFKEVRLYKKGESLTFSIIDPQGTSNKGSVPIHNRLNIHQMITFLKKCDVVVNDDRKGRLYDYPVFISQPRHEWSVEKNEIRLLQNSDSLVSQIYHKTLGYFQQPVDIINGFDVVSMVDYLKNCEVRIHEYQIKFIRTYYTWKWDNMQVKLLRDYDRLIWQVSDERGPHEKYFQIYQRSIIKMLWESFTQKKSRDLQKMTLNCLPSKYCSEATKEVISKPRPIEKVINLLKEFSITKVRLNPLEIEVVPIFKPSQIHPGLFVSKFTYALTMVSGQGPGGNHVQVFIEGIVDDECMPSDSEHYLKGGDYFLYKFELNNTNSIATKYVQNFNKYNTSTYQRTNPWMVSRKKIKIMIASILKDKENGIEYSYLGRNTKTGKGEHNCVTWALEKLALVNVHPSKNSLFQVSIETHLYSTVAAVGKKYTRPPKKLKKVPIQV